MQFRVLPKQVVFDLSVGRLHFIIILLLLHFRRVKEIAVKRVRYFHEFQMFCSAARVRQCLHELPNKIL